MKTKIISLVLLILPIALLASIDSTWNKGGLFTINFSQTSLKNWSSGGQSSFAVLNQANLFVNYQKEKITWNNTLDLAYGIQKRTEEKAFKTDDKIDLNSKYGYTAFDHVNYTAIATFKTQFAPGYSNTFTNKISDFMAPAYLGLSIGLDYMPSDDFTALIAPISSKNTIVNIQELANQGAFGVKKAILDQNGNLIKKGEKFRTQFGGYIKVAFRKNLMENVMLQNQIDFFSDYINKPQNIDIYWDLLLNFKINKFLSSSISSSIVYDDDIKTTIKNQDGTKQIKGPKIQFKEVLAIGLSYKF